MRFYIFASAEKKPDCLSKAIMKKMGTDYSHVGVIVTKDEIQEVNGEIFHAVGDGFCKSTTEEFLHKKKFQHIKEITFIIKSQDFAYGWLHGSIGKEYSSSQYLGFFSKRLGKLVSNGKEKTICSESVADFVNDCTSSTYFKVLPTDFVTPKEVVDFLSAY